MNMLTTFSKQALGQQGASEAQFFAHVERINPVRPPELEADVLVPAAQCALIGVGTFVLLFPLCNLGNLSPDGCWALSLAGAGIAAGVMATDAIRAARQSIYSTETLKDNLVAKTLTQQQTTQTASYVNLTVTREDTGTAYPQVFSRDLPIDEDRLRQLAQAALEGTAITQENFAGGDRLLSRGEFDQTAQLLMELGILAWKSERDPAQGRALTIGGRHALQAWIEGRAQITHASTHASNAPTTKTVGDSLE